ncbi:MAG: T9SS type A sorting domain-containing protein [Bacteroidales bacterium]|nr:T9SS type A sorting domain-containing protein [Bacteroidales bacterium]
MKKTFLFLQILLASTLSSAWTQAILCDSAKVFDTISDLDSCYLFYTPKPCFLPVPETSGYYGGRLLIQEYSATDSVTVYGVALTFKDAHNNTISDNITNIQALLMTYAGPSPINPTYCHSMQLVDSVTLNRSHPRFCWFHYNNDKCNTDSIVQTPCANHPEQCSEIAPCYELYFDTPQQINAMSGTFYVGLEWADPNQSSFYLFPIYYGGRYSTSLPSHLFWAIGSNEYGGYDYFNTTNSPSTYYSRMWGIAFPIIGFRCGPMKNYWLEEYGGNYAIMRWRSTEPGTLFNLRLVGEDGSDTTIVTQDTVYVFNWLSDSYRYNVTLRKQCRYCTSNYDTTVYGAWTPPVYFGTTWRTVTTSVNDPHLGTVSGGGVYPDSSTVTLTANSFNGNEFYKWNDSVTANPRQILVVSDTSFTAIFSEVEDTVTGGDTVVGGDTVGIVLPAAEGFSLQPNPAHGTVHILLPTTATGGRLSLCDVTGREVQACTVTSTAVEWDLSRLPAGTYLVKLSTPQGTATQKLVIQE